MQSSYHLENLFLVTPIRVLFDHASIKKNNKGQKLASFGNIILKWNKNPVIINKENDQN